MGISSDKLEAYRAYLHAVQQTDRYGEFCQVMKEYLSLQEHDTTTLAYVAARIKNVFKGHSKLILGFNNFLPPAYEITLAVEEDGGEQQTLARVEELNCAADSDEGLMHGGERSVASVEELHEAADSDEALEHGDELTLARVEDFNDAADSDNVLPHGECPPEFSLLEKIIKEKFRNPGKYKQCLKCLYIYNKEIISSDELVYIVSDLLSQDPEKDERVTGFEASTSKRRKVEEPMLHHSLLNCELDHNPSYQRSTEKTLASGRTELGKAVLNDSWVTKSTTPTGDKYRFKNNIYQENLFECEDERCERDRQFNLVKGIVECVKNLKRKIEDSKVDPKSMRIEDHFNALHVGCIRGLCSKNGRKKKSLFDGSDKGLVDVIRKNAIPVLDLMLTQLEQQQDEVKAHISNSVGKMEEVYSKNLKKSLF